ncbi:YggN family protein [Thalassotalea maritima]|uniref:YggN family protein n=1 Tax=Thalassotalea maritima TaxID=3242416 RepID=UPI003529CC6F
MKTTILALTTALTLLSTSVNAHDDKQNYNIQSDHCSINLNYGVVVEGDQIRFIDNDETYVQINNAQHLFVNGKQVALNQQQQNLVTDYAEQINKQVPVVVDLANDAVGIAFGAISSVASAFTGDDNVSSDKLDALLTQVQEKVALKFNKDNNGYYIAEQSFDEFEQFMENEIEAEIESVIASFAGDILIAVGTAINSEDGSFEEKMQAFGERMERMGDDIEASVEQQASDLEAKAEYMCDSLQQLDATEQRLVSNIKELRNFNLLDVSD